ncbi:MAG TPA: orotidine-5'-phosphate decarboxylase [Bdellovibrionales bacterium]|nr:orotidine-5'-phosphate decarboxylase [Bdellovibrionales bacterium]
MNSRAALTNPIFVAVDVDTAEDALKLVRGTRAFVGGFKVGPRLSLRYGETLLKEIARHGNMFVDSKFFDIPSTMESAVRAAFECGASFATVHAQAGKEALSLLAELEEELCKVRPFRILAVTILTSFRQDTLAPVVNQMPIPDQAKSLAKLVIDCGLTGLVCSPEEVESLRKAHPGAYLVTPGVRLSHEDRGDQKRVADPRAALARGASALVVGRPIYDAVDPAMAAKTYYEEIQKA